MKNLFKKNEDSFIKFIKSKKNIIAVYLFGSYCDGTYNEKSDIDLAILYDNTFDFNQHLCDSVDVQKIFDNAEIDYISFDEISIFFAFDILKKGKLIYCSDEDKLYKYIAKIQHQNLEMNYSRKKYMDYVLNHNSLED